ncbi:MAG: LysR family transcriptional regulator [Acidiferrobacteraceae bacterium]|jgi:DNA-binding transcriptional LysR family regulator|nr:LysR family transcriptional regulator [Acidiferrobacteraceae bacterium]MBT4806782.1 LysR family transcriptional regulator [Acidiferrobacteraceae bacterium]MBT5343813.1 LysR family transcriptional regulator [Acidiferrobacteraceae bacterium]
MQYSLRQLLHLVCVAEHQNISRAARALFLSQPALSTSIAQLEETLGLQLLIRHHARGVSLTPAGNTFLAQARSLLAHAEEVTAAGRALGESAQGVLEAGCFWTLSPFFLPGLLVLARQRHPELQIQITEGPLDELQTLLRNGQIEMALLYDIDLGRDLECDTLAQVEPHVLLPSGHRLADQASVSLRALRKEPFILLDLPHSRDYFLGFFQKAGFEPKVRHRSRSFELVRGLVASGEGYSILNLQPASHQTYDGGEVKCLPIKDKVSPLSIVLAQPLGLRQTHRASAFVSCCRAYFDSANQD